MTTPDDALPRDDSDEEAEEHSFTPRPIETDQPLDDDPPPGKSASDTDVQAERQP